MNDPLDNPSDKLLDKSVTAPLTEDLFASAAPSSSSQSQHPSQRQLQSVTLQGPVDFEGFRRAARGLLARQVAPGQVSWYTSDAACIDLFNDTPADSSHPGNASTAGNTPTVSVPAGFMTLCETAILHHDAGRFGLLYRILWRLVHEPGLRHDPLDADMVLAQHMAQAVRRDMHKMKAFVRFRTVQDDIFKSDPEGGPFHVAWFEPEHHIVEATAPFFARRFTQMRWAILTPECSAEWDGGQLHFGPGASKQDAPPADAGEQLWLTYYQHIFNPARLKLKMMQKEMPRKYWRNLPEAELISPLTAAAHERHVRMVDQPPLPTMRRMPAVVAARPAAAETTPEDKGGPAHSLGELREATNRCRECPIGELATQAVPGEGPRQARLMFVGEQPGDQEDLRGHPFVGPAGQLFDRALAQLGIQRDEVFVSNAVKHFKYEMRGKRRIHKTPSQREAAACQHWLEDEITLVQPKVLVALGATAARSLMGKAIPVMATRGQFLQRDDGRQVLVTLHPSALLRAPPEQWDTAYAAWIDDLSKLSATA